MAENMPKLHSPYKRVKKEINGSMHYVVTNEVDPDYLWVFEDPDVLMMEKLDGCLQYSTKVITDKGLIEIGQIVNKKMPVNILSYNFNTKTTEFKPIINYHKETRKRDFIGIKVKNKYHGTRPKNIICTDNHKFYTPYGWKEAITLKRGDVVYHVVKKLSHIKQQFLLGGLLGDSSVYWGDGKKNCGFSFIHSIKQSNYFDLKMNIFGNICKEGIRRKGGFEGSKPNRRASSIINVNISDFIKNHCIINGKKTVTEQWANKLSVIGLSIWFMDDGSTSFNGSQNPRAFFATNSFSTNEIKILQKRLFDFGITSNIQNSKFSKGNVLSLTTEGSEIFYHLVAPFITKDLQYKLPQFLRTGKSFWDNYIESNENEIIETVVVDVTNDPKPLSGSFKYQFDLTVKDNSNYFANGILVHNTNVSIVIEDGELKEVWNRKNLVSLLTKKDGDDYIWENTEGFNHVIEGVKNSIELIKEFDHDGQYFGECIGLGIQKNPLDLPDKRWIPFETFGKNHLIYDECVPKDFEEMSAFMKNLKSRYYKMIHPEKEEYAEGIIFYRPSTGERAKLRRDMFDFWIIDNPGVINKHVNTYSKPKKEKRQPEGMAKEFSLLSSRKKQGLISKEEYEQKRDEILKKYGIGGK